ncbi:unnamed protein product [Orchesella dallaii]|uniref:Uncharacterized protein n=1 Tax=Orchesella dallaii TaxID=48710 RepID=A0ABP1PKU0_9HEXA
MEPYPLDPTQNSSLESTPRKSSIDKRTREESSSPESAKPSKSVKINCTYISTLLSQTDLDNIKAMLNDVFDEKLQALDKRCNDTTIVTITKIDNMRREKNIIITGIPEAANEPINDLVAKTEQRFVKIGLQTITVDDISRLRRTARTDGKPRPVLVKLLRKLDKRAIMAGKNSLERKRFSSTMTHPQLYVPKKKSYVTSSVNIRIQTRIADSDLCLGTLQRDWVSQDQVLSRRGEALLELMDSERMLLLNGRALGDIPGEFTFVKGSGRSTIDFDLTFVDEESAQRIVTCSVLA